jgi:hypothetical protein
MALLLIVTIVISGCSMHPKIKADESYTRIKPVAPLPEYERMKVPHNLSILVENVADMNNSYKNRVRLYVNKYEIEPDEIFNYKSSYKYNMKLQPGIYEIKALYYAHTGWKESNFTIKPRDKVKIYLNKKATLKVTLKKNHWGAPVDKVTYFELDYEDLDLNKAQ